MKYYKDSYGTVFAYETPGVADIFCPPDLIEMTESEVMAHVNKHPSFDRALSSLNVNYETRLSKLYQSWTVAGIRGGSNEESIKAEIKDEIAALDAQHDVDITALKSEYGVS